MKGSIVAAEEGESDRDAARRVQRIGEALLASARSGRAS
jgi:hypothetical protein